MSRFPNSALVCLTVFLWVASLCHSVPIRDKIKSNGFADKWRKFSAGGFTKPSSSSFAWEAFIHGPTGVASSNERSGPFSLTAEKRYPWSLPRKHISHNADNTGLDPNMEEETLKQQTIKEEELIIETSRRFVDAWSDFLCQGKISLGILRCEKEYENNRNSKRNVPWRKQKHPTGGVPAPPNCIEASSSSLLARFTTFPVKLLEFGKPVESSLASFVHDNETENSKKDQIVLGSWDIPLVGGGLVLEDDEVQGHSLGSSSTSRADCRGKLMFAIVKRTGSQGESKGGTSTEYELVTGIRNYRPWLAGGGFTEETRTHDSIWDALKANRETTTRRLCHGFYLSTQSMVHAYVTWRFHNAWKKELTTAVRTTSNAATNQ